MKRFAPIATVAALSLTLAACGGGHDEQPPVAEANVTDLGQNVEVPADNVLTEAPPATRIDNAAAEAPPVATLTTDEQTQEDADATGMTARVSRDEAGNEGAAAQ